MTFAWPHLLWLLALPVALFIWEFTRHRRTGAATYPKILRAEAGNHSLRLSTLSAQLSTSRAQPRPWLYLGLLFAIIAFARPQWGRVDEPVFDQSREILIAIDLSRSMLTPDVKPSRLDRAKLLTQSLLEKLEGERVGLVVFSGTAFLQCPLSSDYEILREFLPALGPNTLPEGGTNYGALIDASLDAFSTSNAADRFLIILSDGEATDDNWRDRAQELKKKSIRVISLGVGTAAGAMIPDGTGGLVKDDRGAVVLSKLEPATLRELAELSNGVYCDASTWVDLAGVVNATVDSGRKGDFHDKKTIRLVERFQWPLALAFWFLLVSAYYEFPVRPRPREIKLTTPTPMGKVPPILAGPALVLLLLLPFSPRLHAAVDPGPQLGKIYSRLAYQDKLYAPDYAEIARETLRWGNQLKESGQPVDAGPVRDAIQAVDQLIAIDSKITDWTKLRHDLEALLEKPDDQKKDQQKKDQDKKDQDQKKQDQQDKDKQDQGDQDQQQKDQQNKDQKSKDQQKKDAQSQDKKDQQSEDKDQQSKSDKSDQQKKAESAFGDMKDKQPPQPKPQPGETQKVGGTPEKKDQAQNADPSMAVPLQKLEQLRNQDSPAQLFQMMDADRKPAPSKPKSKDW